MPARDTLGVELYPASVQTDAFKYGKTRVVAVVSDVSADSAGNVIRVSTANTYDKYGRVTETYAYDPTAPADSLKMLAVETEYDLGGKVTRSTKYPYGVDGGGASRKIVERYTYDRLGRIDSLFSKNGYGDEVLLATYSYYPTGSVNTVNMGNSLTISYTYHISGALRTARVTTANGAEWYSEMLHYEDCGDEECTPQYNGNISYMAQRIAHSNRDFVQNREVAYYYDQLNRLTKTDDLSQDYFDDFFEYDAQGRITAQRRAHRADSAQGGEYAYYDSTNRLKSVAEGMGGTGDGRDMSVGDNFVYDRDGNLVEDKSKNLTISYDWRGMPVEFLQQEPSGGSSHATRLVMMYDGSGRRISKTAMRMVGDDGWDTTLVTHYTGIGTETREYKPANFTRYTDSAGVEHCVSANPDYGGNASTACPLPDTVKVAVPLPQGLGRYALQDADHQAEEGAPQAFEWYLKNHLGSTMVVYGTGFPDPLGISPDGELRAAYDYRSFGEQLDLFVFTRKVTENFTGKEKDDETGLSYHEARYLDPMLGVWISMDPKRFFPSPYLYMGNGYNPISSVDTTGKTPGELAVKAAIAAPSALYNMYQVQEKLSEQGASWTEMSIKGAAVLFGTLFISIIAPNSDKPIAAGFLGAGTALTTNAISQKYIEEKTDVDLKELGNAAKNVFFIGTSTAVGKAAASTIFMEPTSGFIGDAVGVTTEIIIDKCEDK